MNSVRRLIILLLLVTFGCTRAPKFGPKDGLTLPPSDVERVKINQPAPDFTLEDASGKHVTLSSLRGNKFVILIFYRGYW